MADDKKQEPAAEAGAKPKKKLPAIVLVALGAIAGGAGVVFLAPPKQDHAPVAEPAHVMLEITHPDKIEHEFNPRTQNGKAFGRVAFQFLYKVRDDHEDAAFEAIKTNWAVARSNALLLLRARSMEDLGRESGQRALEKDLVDELDHVFFPGKDHDKIAKVTRIVWDKFLIQ